MTGLLALHGGGEYVAGDEAAMDALLLAAADAAAQEAAATRPRIAIVPTAAARQRPDAAVATGERAFAATAERAGLTVEIGAARILSRRDAADPRVLEGLASAHLIHFPGGDPDLIPDVLHDTPAWAAVRRAYDVAGVIAGASAGAMALAGPCWPPRPVADATRPGRLAGPRRTDAGDRPTGRVVDRRRARPGADRRGGRDRAGGGRAR